MIFVSNLLKHNCMYILHWVVANMFASDFSIGFDRKSRRNLCNHLIIRITRLTAIRYRLSVRVLLYSPGLSRYSVSNESIGNREITDRTELDRSQIFHICTCAVRQYWNDACECSLYYAPRARLCRSARKMHRLETAKMAGVRFA